MNGAALWLFAVLGFLGPGAPAFQFALVPKLTEHPFFTASREGCDVAAAQLNDTCLYVGPQTEDAEEQAEWIRNLVTDSNRTVDGIAASVGVPDIVGSAIDFAVASGVPVVTFDSDAPDTQRTTYIGTDNIFFGEQLAKTLIQLTPTGGTYAALGNLDARNVHERIEGMRTTLQKTNLWRELPGSPAKISTSNLTASFDTMQSFIDNHAVTAILMAQVGPMALIDDWKAFVNKNRGKVVIVNADALDFQVELLGQRYVDGLVGQLPYEMGLTAIETLHRIASGESIEEKSIGTNLLIHLKVPLQLPELIVKDNLIGTMKYFGFFLFGTVTVAVALCGLWTYKYRSLRVVASSQPIFLAMIVGGVWVMGSAIIPLSFDDGGNVYDERGNLDFDASAQDADSKAIAICMSTPWLALVGFATVFSALFSKTWRINRIFHSKNFTRVTVSVREVIVPYFCILGANVLVLLLWTILDPLAYVRTAHEGTDGWNRKLSTYGSCRSQHAIWYLVPLTIINAFVLAIANWQAYEARYIESEFAESKHIGVVMASMFQASSTGIPILLIVRDNPQAFYIVLVMMIFVISMVTLLVIFVPKILYVRQYQQKSKRTQGRILRDAIINSSKPDSSWSQRDEDSSKQGTGPTRQQSPANAADTKHVTFHSKDTAGGEGGLKVTELETVVLGSEDLPDDDEPSETLAAEASNVNKTE